MKGVVLLADAARVHPDGTFSLLRGGIDRVQVPRTQPIHFRGSVLARITGEAGEGGEHDFKIRVINEDGQSIAPDISGLFQIKETGGSAVVAVDCGFVLPAYGRYSFVLIVNRHQVDSWDLRAVEAEPPRTAGGANE